MATEVTLADANERYFANRGYDVFNSLPMAQEFVLALRDLLRLLPNRMSQGGNTGESIQHDADKLMSMLERAEDWVAAEQRKQTTGGGAYISFQDFRTAL